LSRRDPRLALVVATLAMAFVGFGASLALIPDRVDELGHGDGAVGLAAGLFPLGAIVGRLLSGRLIDRAGSRSAMAWGIGLTAAGSFALALPYLGGLLMARSLQGFGDGILYTAAAASTLDLAPPERRGQALGWLSAGIWSGLSLGAALGGVLPGLAAAGLVFGVLTLGSAALVPLLPKGLVNRGSAPLVLVAREAIRPGAVVGLTNLGYAAITGFVVVLAADRFDHGNWVLTAWGVTLLLVRGCFGWVADRIAPQRGLDMAHVVLATGVLIVAAAPHLWVAVVGAMIAAFGHSLPYPILVTTTIDRSGEERRGAVLGTMTAGFDITVAVALFAFGLISSWFGTPTVFVVAAVGIGAANLIARPLHLPRTRRRDELAPLGTR
jgi:MFS family permease